MPEISVGGVPLPSAVSINESDEPVWSEDTGRTMTARMVGDIVAHKDKISVKWEFLQKDEVLTILNALRSSYITVTYQCARGNRTIEAYRGAINMEQAVNYRGRLVYKSVSVNLTER